MGCNWQLRSAHSSRPASDRFWPTAPIRDPISSKRRHRASLDGPYSRRHLTPRREAQEDAAGASGGATPKDSNTPQETLTIEASEPPNAEVNHEQRHRNRYPAPSASGTRISDPGRAGRCRCRLARMRIDAPRAHRAPRSISRGIGDRRRAPTNT